MKTHNLTKYGNRKLYSTKLSRYVNLKDIVAMVQANEDVRVNKYVGNEDVTALTLSKAFVLAGVNLPTWYLNRLIKTDGQELLTRGANEQNESE